MIIFNGQQAHKIQQTMPAIYLIQNGVLKISLEIGKIMSIKRMFNYCPSTISTKYIKHLQQGINIFMRQGLTLIFILALICSFLCCCQVFCVPKFKVFFRCCYVDIQTDTKSNKEKYFLFFSLLFISALTIVASGLAYQDKEIQSSSLQLRCTSLWMIITTLSQNNKFEWKANWQGLDAIDDQIMKFASTLNDSKTLNVFQQMADINIKPIQMEYKDKNQSIYDLYSNNSNKLLINPNPLTSNKIAFLNSSYIQELGPVEQIGTITNALDQELQTREAILQVLQQVSSISEYLINETTILQTQFLSTKNRLDRFSLNFIKFISKIESKVNDRKWIVNSAVEAYKNYLILVVIFCFLSLVSFSLVTWARFQKMAFLLHIVWIALDLFLLLGLLMLAFVYYASVINDNIACNLSNEILSNDKVFQLIVKLTRGNKYLYDQTNNDEMTQLMKICLYSKGDLLTFFQLNDPVQQVSHLNGFIGKLQQYKPTKLIIQSQIKFVKGVLQNYGEAIQDVSSNNNPNDMLKILNEWSDFNGLDSLQLNQGKCRVSQDEWEWNDKNCKYHSYYVQFIENSEPDYEFGWTICFNFNEVSEDFAEKRYSNPLFKECSQGIDSFNTVQNASIEYFNNLRQYIISVQEVFHPILISLKDYSKKLDLLDLQIKQSIENITNSAYQLDDVFTPITSGIISSMNCSFIQDGFNRVRNSFCITLQDGLFFMYVYLISITSLLSLKIILAVWSAMRCIPNDKHILFLEDDINSEQQKPNRNIAF